MTEPDFFTRNQLPQSARSGCWDLAESLCGSSTIRECPSQGFCSYTLLLPDDGIVMQFRPPKYRLDLAMTDAASSVLGNLAPQTRLLGSVTFDDDDDDNNNKHTLSPIKNDENEVSATTLHIYAHTLIRGTSLPAFLRAYPHHPHTTAASSSSSPCCSLTPLVRSLARGYFLPAYRHALPGKYFSSNNNDTGKSLRKGLIGRTLHSRVALLRAQLPVRFGHVVERVWLELDGIVGDEGSLPWALTHGDLVGNGVGNVIVGFDDETDRVVGGGHDDGGGGGGLDGDTVETGASGKVEQVKESRDEEGRAVGVRLRGLVDWAEGEYLPLGIGLYGLEEILGRMVEYEDEIGTRRRRFEYYPCADQLREAFWDELEAGIPELANDAVLRRKVETARLLGLLLWYGIAFDDGALDRVVRPGTDDEELQKLDLFLLGPDHDDNNSSTGIEDCTSDAGSSANDSAVYLSDEEDDDRIKCSVERKLSHVKQH